MSKIFGGLRANNKVSIKVKRGTVHALIGPERFGQDHVHQRRDRRVLARGGRGLVLRRPHLRQARLRHGRDGHGPHVPEPAAVAAHDRPRERHGRAARPREGRPVRPRAWCARRWARREEERHAPARAGPARVRRPARSTPTSSAGELPYGPQRRLEVARALALDPACCILDEPAAGLNPAEVGEFTGLIRKIKRHRDHGVPDRAPHGPGHGGVSDQISVLDYGTKIADGTPGGGRPATRRSSRPTSARRAASDDEERPTRPSERERSVDMARTQGGTAANEPKPAPAAAGRC